MGNVVMRNVGEELVLRVVGLMDGTNVDDDWEELFDEVQLGYNDDCVTDEQYSYCTRILEQFILE